MVAPDWYNDKADPTLARWHDGVGWTEHVVEKAPWVAAGHPPPPPEALLAPAELDAWEEPGATPAPGRLRTALGVAAVVAVLVVAGVALADGGDDPPPAEPAARADVDPRRTGAGASGFELDLGATTGGPGDLSDGDAADQTGAVGSSADAPARTATTRRAAATGGTTRTTARSSTSGGVQRTERATQTRTDPGPVNQVGGGDQTDVGNTSDRIIVSDTVPAETTTTAAASPGVEL